MDRYNFKIVALQKEDLTTEEKETAVKLINYWQQRKGLVKQDEDTFFRVATDDRDLSATTVFAHKLSKYPQLFKRVEVVNISKNHVTRFL